MKRIGLIFDSDLDAVSVAGTAMRIFCERLGFDSDSSRDVELCVVEAATNCVAHAYGDHAEGPIKVCGAWTGASLEIWVRDEGKAIEPSVRDHYLTRNGFEIAGLVEGGRGLLLMASLMNELKFLPTDGIGNAVFMRKDLPRVTTR